MSSPTRYTIFVLLKTRPAWLALSRPERNRIAEQTLGAAVQEGGIDVRLFDAEAFATHCTDVAMLQTSDLQAYYFAIERLRDSPLFTVPYFEMVGIIPAIENGFRTFEAAQTLQA